MDFGEKLKLLIDEKGISVSRLAQMTVINRNTLYSFIRRGTQKIDPVIIHKLAASLDVDPFYFLDAQEPVDLRSTDADSSSDTTFDEKPAPALNAEREEFAKLFSCLNPENRQRILDLMKALLSGQGSGDARQE